MRVMQLKPGHLYALTDLMGNPAQGIASQVGNIIVTDGTMPGIMGLEIPAFVLPAWKPRHIGRIRVPAEKQEEEHGQFRRGSESTFGEAVDASAVQDKLLQESRRTIREVNALLDRAQETQDPAESERLWREAHRIMGEHSVLHIDAEDADMIPAMLAVLLSM
jgi:hypothetical protein